MIRFRSREGNVLCMTAVRQTQTTILINAVSADAPTRELLSKRLIGKVYKPYSFVVTIVSDEQIGAQMI